LIYQLIEKEYEMKTSINTLIKDYNDIINRAKEIFNNRTAEEINKKPSPKSWSAAECIEHLNTYAAAYLANTKILSPSATDIDRNKVYSPRFLPAKFIKAVGPDTKLKLKSIQIGSSYSSTIDISIIDQFIGHQKKFLEVLNQISFEDLKRIKVVSPFARLLKFQLGEMLLLTSYHQQRHLNQAERAINS